MSISEKEVLNLLKEIEDKKINDYVYDYIQGKKQLPEYYCENKSKIKAIILGCDPSNYSGYELEKVFGLGENDDKRFFKDIESNLKAVGLEKSDIYVQNLCKNYFDRETSDYFKNLNSRKIFGNRKKNIEEDKWKEIIQKEREDNEWLRIANQWVDLLNDELDSIDKNKEVPVLITTQYLLLPLIKPKNEMVIKKPSFYYSNEEFMNNGFIIPEQNKLERTIIPFYRNKKYRLSNNDNWKYRKNIIEKLNEIRK